MHRPDYYTKAQDYWKSVPATVNGMLGGLEVLSEPDARDSLNFINEFICGENPFLSRRKLACDCGAGIGRVSKTFLLKVFEKVDLVEQDHAFLRTAQQDFSSHDDCKVEQFIAKGLQDFAPESNRYDFIWCQWVLGHLTDVDLIAFLKRCKEGIKTNGLLGIKENTTSKGSYEFDAEDSSVTRSDAAFRDIFEKAGYKLLKTQLQTDFPKGLFPVRMYMLQAE